MYEQIAYGIVVGIGYSIIGWTKANQVEKKKTKAEKKLSWLHLGKSIVVCGIVGGAAGYSGQDFGVLIVGSMGVGVTKSVDLAWAFIKKLFKKK